MGLKNVLEKHKNDIIRKWFDTVADTYPQDTARFLKSQKDPFANPVGGTTRQSLESVFNELLSDADPARIRDALDPVIRIRAVQTFSPSHATSFVFSLKHIVKEFAEKESCEPKDFIDFSLQLDAVSLMAFEIYMTCREKVWQIRATEQRDRTFKAFHRAGLVSEAPEENPGLYKNSLQ